MRPSKERTFMTMARALALRSTCRRLQVGALITDADGLQVLGIGYNGNAAGLYNGCDNADAIGNCGCIHAELNAMLKAPGTVSGKTLYTTTAPCETCAKLILNANITRVIVGAAYRTRAGVILLSDRGISVESDDETSAPDL